MVRFAYYIFALALGSPVVAGEDPTQSDSTSEIEILSISELPDFNQIPYPNGASVCLCQNSLEQKILVAIPAFKDREVLAGFQSLKSGDILKIELIPWGERPTEARAMAIANQFRDEFDMLLYYAATYEEK